jgi:PPOX class probable F420-dependent enzyme
MSIRWKVLAARGQGKGSPAHGRGAERHWRVGPRTSIVICVEGRGLAGAVAPDAIPPSHLDLVDCPPIAVLTTVTATGYPHSSVVWCDYDGQFVRVNTMRGFAKERNMRANPRVALLCFDPREPLRYLEVRGHVAAIIGQGRARQHLDQLSSRYMGRAVCYFGDVVPAQLAETEEPVLFLIRPGRVVAVDCTDTDGGGDS